MEHTKLQRSGLRPMGWPHAFPTIAMEHAVPNHSAKYPFDSVPYGAARAFTPKVSTPAAADHHTAKATAMARLMLTGPKRGRWKSVLRRSWSPTVISPITSKPHSERETAATTTAYESSPCRPSPNQT
eukprot:scaffold297742_cov36-Tisochrysis_lutea.AAC.2